MKRLHGLRLGALTIALAAVALMPFQGASARHLSGTVMFHVGDDFLTAFDPSFGPVVSRARNGDEITITGTGTFSFFSRQVTGGGTIVHRDADGNLIGQGTWKAIELFGYHAYGSATTQGLPAEFEGGRATFLVHLFPEGAPAGAFLPGFLSVDCTLGDRIPSQAFEGISLRVPGHATFSEPVSGATLFHRL